MSDVSGSTLGRSHGGRHRKSSVRQQFSPPAASAVASHQQRRLTASLFVGRVGALALALGVGFGWSSASAIAHADPAADAPNVTDGSGAPAPSRGKAPTSRRVARSAGTAVEEAPVGRPASSAAATASLAGKGAAPAPASAQRDGRGLLETVVSAALTSAVPDPTAASRQTTQSPAVAVATAAVTRNGRRPAAGVTAPLAAAAVPAPVSAVSGTSVVPTPQPQPAQAPTRTVSAARSVTAAANASTPAWTPSPLAPLARVVIGFLLTLGGMNAANPQPTNIIQRALYSLALGINGVFDPPPPAGTPTVGTANTGTGAVSGSLGFPAHAGLTFTASTPAQGTVTLAADGSFVYTPTQAARQAADLTTTDTFTATAHEGLATTSVTVTVPVDPGTPVAGQTTVSTPNPSTGIVTGTAIFTDTAGRTLSYSGGARSAGGGSVHIDQTTGAFTYTPTDAQREAATETPTDTFSVIASNGVRSASQTITVVVAPTPVDHPPVLQNPGVSVTGVDPATGVVSGAVHASDPDGDVLTYSAPGSTAKGVIHIDPATGTFTYTPTVQPGPIYTADGSSVALPTDFGVVGSGGFALIPHTTTGYVQGYTADGAPALAVVDFATGTVTATVEVGSPNTGVGNVAVRADGAYAYLPTVTHDDTAPYGVSAVKVSVIDTATNTVTATIALPTSSGINDIVLSSDGTRAYLPTYQYGLDEQGGIVFNGASITVLDTTANTVLDSIAYSDIEPSGFSWAATALNPAGTALYVGTYQGASADAGLASAIAVIDTATGAVSTIDLAGLNTSINEIVFSPDGQRAYVNSCHYGGNGDCDDQSHAVIVVDTATNAVVGSIPVFTDPGSVPSQWRERISPDGRFLHVVSSNVISDDSGQIISRPGLVSVIDTAANTVVDTVAFPVDPTSDRDTYPIDVAISPDGTKAYLVTETFDYTTGAVDHTVFAYSLDQRTDAFTVTVSDGRGGTLAVPVAVPVIAGINAEPAFVITATDSLTGVVTGRINAASLEGIPLVYRLTINSMRGVVSLSDTGQFTYTPTATARHAAAVPSAPAALKEDTFTVTVTVASGEITDVVIVVPVISQNTAPTGNVDLNPFLLADGTPFGVANTYNGRVNGVVKGIDADLDKVRLTASGATNGTVRFTGVYPDPGGGPQFSCAFTYTPTAEARAAAGTLGTSSSPMTDSFSVNVDDGHGGITSIPVTVAISPTSTGRVITLNGTPRSVKLSPDGKHAYVATGSGGISVIDTATNSVAAVIDASATDFLVNPTGTRILGESGVRTGQRVDTQFQVIDTSSNAVLVNTVLVGAQSAVISASGTRAYVPYFDRATSDGSGVKIAVLDLTTGAVLPHIDAPTLESISLFANSVDGKVYGVAGADALLVIDPVNDNATVRALSGSGVTGSDAVVAASADGRTLYLANEVRNTISMIDCANLHVTAGAPGVDVLAPGGDTLHLVDSSWLAVISPSNEVSTIAPVASYPPGGAPVLSADRRSVFVIQADPRGGYFPGGVLLCDPASGDLVGFLPVDYTSAAVRADGAIYFTDSKHDTVTMLPDSQLKPVDLARNLGPAYTLTGFDQTFRDPQGVQVGREYFGTVAVDAQGRSWVLVNGWQGTMYGQKHLYSIVKEFDPGTPDQPKAFVLDGWHDDLVLGLDGKLYASHWNATDMVAGQSLNGNRVDYIDIVSPDGEHRQTQAITEQNRCGSMVVDALGRVYAGNIVINPDGTVETLQIPSDSRIDWKAVGADGSVYGLTPARLLVLRPDRTYSHADDADINGVDSFVFDLDGQIWFSNRDTMLTVRGVSQAQRDRTGDPTATHQQAEWVDEYGGKRSLATDGGGIVYVSSTRAGLRVVDTRREDRTVYSVGAFEDIPGGGVETSSAGYAYVVGRDANFRTIITVVAPRTPSTPTQPIRVDMSYPALGSGPTDPAALWTEVKKHATGVNDGVLVQTVRGTDGKTRMVAYIGGTTGEWGLTADDNQGIFENAVSRLGIPKPDQVSAIQAAIQQCNTSTACGSVDEILLVGYSQGGMDAQNIAFWNAAGVPVAGVVTFGSPIIAINPAVTSLHIQDSADGVVAVFQDLPAAVLPINPVTLALLKGPKTAADLRGEVYSGRSTSPIDSPLPWLGVHANDQTYADLSQDFWATPADQYSTQKAVIDRFLGGTLIGQWPASTTTVL